MSAADIKVDSPLVPFLCFLESIELKRIYYTLVFWACDLVVELHFLKTINPLWLNILYSAAFGVFEEDGGRPIFEDTSDKMHFVSFFIRMFFAI